MTYERLGMENDGDLVTLCSSHHYDLHEYVKQHKKKLYRGSMEYIGMLTNGKIPIEEKTHKKKKKQTTYKLTQPERTFLKDVLLEIPFHGNDQETVNTILKKLGII